MTKLQFQFDPDLDYQKQAVQSVVDVFTGMPRYQPDAALGQGIVGNLHPYEKLDEGWLNANVRAVQKANDPDGKLLDRTMHLQMDEGLLLNRVSPDAWRYPNFTIEMETGTGKTYVYLRTIHELYQKYGFRKFVVVVPSIAIYEGIIKNYQITCAHFAALYHNPAINLYGYDSSRMSTLRTFATATSIEVLVMTIQSFRLARNKIYRPSEQLPGELLPYEYIQQTRPILILDEPQNLETKRARASLRTLKPLFGLRYSATHKTTPNHLYSLTPFEAYRRGLVKKVQVDAITERDDFNRPFLHLEAIHRKHGIRATVTTYIQRDGSAREATVSLRDGDDLFEKTGREEHRGGYIVAEIHAGQKYLRFANGVTLHLQETIGPARPEIFRVQIERTIQRHIERQAALADDQIKVLSLFFIDRVANYTDEDGLIRRLFDEAFEKHKHRFALFSDRQPHEVREGYFAQRTKYGKTEFVDTDGSTKAERLAEREAFELIMRDKERLLSFDEPVSFVFAHSALKEGWDNPNVFQICTLNQTVSEMKKRQEIGRGLRIAVDQTGKRIFGDDINILTVVANESYQSYAESLQQEYIDDGHFNPPPRPSRADDTLATRNDDIFNNARFQAFWQKLIQGTSYHIHIDTETLIAACVERLNNIRIPDPVIIIESAEYVVTSYAITFEAVRGDTARIRVEIQDTRGREEVHANFYERLTDFAKLLEDPRLRGFKIKAIDTGVDPTVTFYNREVLHLDETITFESQTTQQPRREQAVGPRERSFPIFNLLERAAHATHLTRPTLNTIFRRLLPEQQKRFLENPEGFANIFISQIQQALADHVADHIEFQLSGDTFPYDLQHLFPPQKEFPQHELIPGNPTSLYNEVQVDSQVEENFVQQQLHPDPRVVAYFKFPPKFKIPFPKLLGNYNPDWGILRYDDHDTLILELVRETKGAEDVERLQFPHERRKIQAAERHFRAVGLDYRVVTDRTPQWWLSKNSFPEQDEFEM